MIPKIKTIKLKSTISSRKRYTVRLGPKFGGLKTIKTFDKLQQAKTYVRKILRDFEAGRSSPCTDGCNIIIRDTKTFKSWGLTPIGEIEYRGNM